ncbi:MAG TPA: glycosyltransferase [Candidatus Dormibacteraeota bacterium]|nr:glycosyltransferase [Candidatus Dormibacteraeota bacterium]
MSDLRISIVIPAYNEGEEIIKCLDQILAAVTSPCELLVVFDRPEDTTADPARRYAEREPRIRPLLNDIRPGPAAAILAGIRQAQAPVVVVTMADGSDQPAQIEELAGLVEEGAVVAAASRYMRGGSQVGGPWLKGLVSRTAGVSLHLLARVGTHDPTNSFKAYSKAFIEEVGVESDAGFEMGIEMVAKAKRRHARVVEIPTVWLDRTVGQSNFKIRQWIPRYLRWYLFALLPFYGGKWPPRS